MRSGASAQREVRALWGIVRGGPWSLPSSSCREKLGEYRQGDNPKYTNIALNGKGRMVIGDSEGGQLLEVEWPARGLELHPYR